MEEKQLWDGLRRRFQWKRWTRSLQRVWISLFHWSVLYGVRTRAHWHGICHVRRQLWWDRERTEGLSEWVRQSQLYYWKLRLCLLYKHRPRKQHKYVTENFITVSAFRYGTYVSDKKSSYYSSVYWDNWAESFPVGSAILYMYLFVNSFRLSNYLFVVF